MQMVDWILLAIAGFCIALVCFIIWLGPSPRHERIRLKRDKAHSRRLFPHERRWNSVVSVSNPDCIFHYASADDNWGDNL